VRVGVVHAAAHGRGFFSLQPVALSLTVRRSCRVGPLELGVQTGVGVAVAVTVGVGVAVSMGVGVSVAVTGASGVGSGGRHALPARSC